MSVIGMRAPRERVTLGSLLAARDASIALKPSVFALAGLRAKRALGSASGRGGRAIVRLAALLGALIFRHALVLGGLSLFVLAALQVSTLAGLIVAGVSLFFLELRRR